MIFPLPESYGWHLDVPVADEDTARAMRKMFGAEVMDVMLRLAGAEERGEPQDQALVRRLQVAIACRDEWDAT